MYGTVLGEITYPTFHIIWPCTNLFMLQFVLLYLNFKLSMAIQQLQVYSLGHLSKFLGLARKLRLKTLWEKKKIYLINSYDLEGLVHFKIKNYKHWFYLNLALESNFYFYQSLLFVLYGRRTFIEEIWIKDFFYKRSAHAYYKNMLAQSQVQILSIL